MNQQRTMRAKVQGMAPLYFIVSLGIACFCTACGQTGPLTLAEPGEQQSLGADDSDEPEGDDSEQDDSEQSTGER